MMKFILYHYQQNQKQSPKRGTTAVSFYDPLSPLDKNQVVIVPNMATFIRDITEYGNIGAIKKRFFTLSLGQMITLCWWNKFAILKLAKKDFATGLLLLLQIEVLKTRPLQPAMYVLSDQVTDLAVALHNVAILTNFQFFMKYQVKADFGYMTNNFVAFIDVAAKAKLTPQAIFAPFNVSGYEMNPSQRVCEQALQFVPIEKIVAIATDDTKNTDYLTKLGITRVLQGWF